MKSNSLLLTTGGFTASARLAGPVQALLLYIFVLLPAAFAQEPPAGCVVVERQGKVEVARKGSTAWSPAQPNETLQVGDRIRTGLRARATLRWSELAVIRVDELTSMEIQPPAKAGAKPELELKSGATYFFSREKPEEIQFRTPVASGAIRGTEFNLRVAEDGRTELALLHGEVALTNAEGSATLKGGELGRVVAGSAPTKTPLINAINVIQWVLHYPAVVDLDEIGLSDTEKQSLAASLQAYREGALLAALKKYPEGRVPASDAERLFLASLELAAGQPERTEAELQQLGSASPIANALREVIAAVKDQEFTGAASPGTASEFMARSYSLQSRRKLEEARDAARSATVKAPEFGAAWIRLAELEFGFGRTGAAGRALRKGLALSPNNAAGLTLEGFVLSAQNRTDEALASFNWAIATDGALADAWLGRGLSKIRNNREIVRFLPDRYRAGLDDLLVAAALAPQRSVLRSYLGKALDEAHHPTLARKELDLAKTLDPNDPTGWLYSALLNQEQSRVNEAVSDLEKSKELNDNRSLFRSQLLLDKDRAVRGANLAAIYRDNGMLDRSVQEASQAVQSDYANFSAHLFLANSYDALRDPNLINLRYETAWYSELLVANLLAPVGGGNLSQNISQQDYSRFFESDGVGIFSSTTYLSSGDWIQNGSIHGLFGSTSFSFDAGYRSQAGDRPNNDFESVNLAFRMKEQITAQDSVFFQIGYFNSESGDVAQYYYQTNASQTLRVEETQDPNLLVGYHREWSPASHTLMLFSRFDDTLTRSDSNPGLLWLRTAVSPISGATNVSVRYNPPFWSQAYESELIAYSGELQQIWQQDQLTLVGGGRIQWGTADTTDNLIRDPGAGQTNQVLTANDADLTRYSVYGYAQWQLLDSLKLIGGVSYDWLQYPVNIDTSPISVGETDEDQVSPKAAIVWTPAKSTSVRGIYTRSLGGAFFDNSIRLEPATLAGFNQAYRSILPESVAGIVPGTKFETWGLGFDQAFKSRTYFFVQGEILNSDGQRTVGVLTNSDTLVPIPDQASSMLQTLDYDEKSLVVSVNQLLGDDFALGARYKLTLADLETQAPGLSTTLPGIGALNQDVSATLNQLWLYAIYQHRCGFFAQFDSIWSQQSNSGYAAPGLPGDNFWQFNFSIGYRLLQRRAEIRLGLLNLTDQDYQLNPLTLYNELPRERTFAVTVKLDF